MPTQAELIRSMKERVFQVKEKLDPQINELNSLIDALTALTGEPRELLMDNLHLSFLKEQVISSTESTSGTRRPRKSPVYKDKWREKIIEALKQGPVAQKDLLTLLQANSGTISTVVREMIADGEINIIGLSGRSRVLALPNASSMQMQPGAVDGVEHTITPLAEKKKARETPPVQRNTAAVKEMIRTFLRANPTSEFTNKEIARHIDLRDRQVYHRLVEMREGNPPQILMRRGEKGVGGLGIAPNMYRINPEWIRMNQ